MTKKYLILLFFILFVIGCQSEKNFACLDGQLVESEYQCSSHCGDCKCQSPETQYNCARDCDPNYNWYNEKCPPCAPIYRSDTLECVAGDKAG